MRRLIRNRPGTWLVAAVTVLCIGLSGCGGDDGGGDGGDPDGGTGPSAAPGSVAPPDTSGGNPAANDEYCDALLAAMDEYSASASSQSDFSELAAQFVAALRKVEPHAPDDVAGDLETFISFYEQVAAGGLEAVGPDTEEFSAALQGVFGPCAVMPPMPPLGS